MSHPALVATDCIDSCAYPIPFREAHQNGVPHRAVHMEIKRKDRWLVWRRGDQRWEIPGGHVDWLETKNAPESYFDAAVRELFEELNLETNWKMPSREALARLGGHLHPVGRLINQLPSSHGDNNEHVAVFELSWQEGWGNPCDFVLGPEVHSKPCWMTLDGIYQTAANHPTEINAALRLFLGRRGILIPIRHSPRGSS